MRAVRTAVGADLQCRADRLWRLDRHMTLAANRLDDRRCGAAPCSARRTDSRATVQTGFGEMPQPVALDGKAEEPADQDQGSVQRGALARREHQRVRHSLTGASRSNRSARAKAQRGVCATTAPARVTPPTPSVPACRGPSRLRHAHAPAAPRPTAAPRPPPGRSGARPAWRRASPDPRGTSRDVSAASRR